MEPQKNYFEVTWKSTGDASRVADPVSHDFDFSRRLRQPGRLAELPDLRWTWPNSEHPPGDIVVAVDGERVVSQRMKDILESHQTVDDEIQWLPGTVIGPNGIEQPHWVPHFPQDLDLYDQEHSDFGPNGIPIRYVLSSKKLAAHAVTRMHRITSTFVLAEQVVDDLKNAGCTGLMYMKLRVGV